MNYLLLSPSSGRLGVRGWIAVAVLMFLGTTWSISARASQPTPETGAVSELYGTAWKTETQPDIAAFNAWAQHLTDAKVSTTSGANTDASAIQEGVRLAKQRRAAMLKLMRTDPARVLAAGVPTSVRAKLPARVLHHLETPFSAVGDYTEYGALRGMNGPGVTAIRRQIRINGRAYETYVYGRRIGITSKHHIFLHGVLIGSEAVLEQNVLRVLTPEEVAHETRVPKVLAVATGKAGSDSGPALAEAGGTLYQFVSAAHLNRAETLLRALEAHRTPETSRVSEQSALENPAGIPTAADTTYTTGNKNVLIIRVDFSDLPGGPTGYDGTNYTAAYVQNVADTQIKPYYDKSSFHLTGLTNTVSANVYRMPRTASYYATNGDNDGLHSDARAAAGADYNVSSYDRVVVLFSELTYLTGSQIDYGGLSEVGGPYSWINGEFDFRVVAHELGHTYGLIHANLWQVNDGNPISPNGYSVEYGDDFDTMSANYANSLATDFNVWYKTQLGWVTSTQIQPVSASGVYRVYQFDGGSVGGNLSLVVTKDDTRNYWVSARRNFIENSTMTHGVYVTWGYNDYDTQDNLLDMETPGVSDTDAALPTGTTFTDSAAGITITPLDEGGTAPNAYEDVQITFGSPTMVPAINSGLNASAQVGIAFTYEISATQNPTSFGATNLPPGLSLDSSSGLITGTATQAGSYSVGLSATNADGTGTATLALTVTASVAPNVLTVISSPAAGGTVTGGGDYTAGTNATIGVTAASGWQISGLTISPATTYVDDLEQNYLSAVANGDGAALTSLQGGVLADENKTIEVIFAEINSTPTPTPTPTATPTPTPAGIALGVVGNPASEGIVTGAGTYAVDSNAEVSADAAAGWMINNITVTPADNSLENIQQLFLQQEAAQGVVTAIAGTVLVDEAKMVTFTFAPINSTPTPTPVTAPVITSALTATSQANSPFTYQITADNTPTTFYASGMPPGLSIATFTGVIFGTPTMAGMYTVLITATNAGGSTTANLTLTLTEPLPIITIVAAGDRLARAGGPAAKVIVRRTGDDTTALIVNYRVKGSARAGIDIKPLTGTVTIPVGAAQAKIKIKPVASTTADDTRQAKIQLLPSPDGNYSVGAPALAKVKILAND